MEAQFRSLANRYDPLTIEKGYVLLRGTGHSMEGKLAVGLRVITIVSGFHEYPFMGVFREVPEIGPDRTTTDQEVALNIDSGRFTRSKDGFRSRQAAIGSRADIQQEFAKPAVLWRMHAGLQIHSNIKESVFSSESRLVVDRRVGTRSIVIELGR